MKIPDNMYKKINRLVVVEFILSTLLIILLFIVVFVLL